MTTHLAAGLWHCAPPPAGAEQVAQILHAQGLDVSDVRVLDDRHADRPVFRARIVAGGLTGNGDSADVVIKYHGTAAAEAHEVSRRLWAGPLGPGRTAGDGTGETAAGDAAGVPCPIAVAAPSGLVITGFVPGPPAGRRGVPADPALTAAAAHLLARLHRTPVPSVSPAGRAVVPGPGATRGPWRVRDHRGILRSLWRKVSDLVPRDEATASRLGVVVALLDRGLALRPVHDEPLVITHGDFSPRNVLLGPDGPVLIDVDRVRISLPGRDLAYWGAWDWATRAMAGEQPSWRVADDLVSAYRRAAPEMAVAEVSDVEATMALHRVAALVRIAHGWSALREPQNAPVREWIVAEALRWARRVDLAG